MLLEGDMSIDIEDLGWIKFEYYGVDEDHLIKNFDKIERSLIRAWEASWYA